jgi:hypothetical protein
MSCVSFQAVLDSASPWVVWRRLWRLRRAQTLILYWNTGLAGLRLRLTVWLCRILFGKNPVVKPIRSWMLLAANPEAVRALESENAGFNRGLIRAIAAHLDAPEKDVLKFVKSSLVDGLAAKAHIRTQLGASPGDAVLILTDNDRFHLYPASGAVLRGDGEAIFRWRPARLCGAMLGAIAVLARRMAGAGFRLRRRAPMASDLFVHAAHFGYADGIRREFVSEDYVFDPSRVALLITDKWRAPDERLRQYKEHLRRRGIRHADVADFAIDPGLLLRLAAVTINFVRRTWREVAAFSDLKILLQCLNFLLEEEIFLAHCRPKALLCFDDYAPGHIVRTLLYRQRGVRTFGIQHSAGNGLHGVPNLAYVCFDRYLIFGRFFRKLFHPYWEDVPLVEFSYNRIDKFLRSRAEGSSASGLPRVPGKKNILITLPSTTSAEGVSVFPNNAGMLDFLRGVDAEISERGCLFVRPKYKEGIDEMKERIANDRVRFVVEHEASTTELLASADLVVASNGSGILMECALLRVPVLTYDYFGFLRKHWTPYGNDLCLNSAEEIRSRLLAFLRGEALDVDWERLWSDLVYPNDGHTNRILERLLDEIPPAPESGPALTSREA